MRELLTGAGVLVAVMVASWIVMIVLAGHLPEGTLKELASFLPDCVTTDKVAPAIDGGAFVVDMPPVSTPIALPHVGAAHRRTAGPAVPWKPRARTGREE
jgi:hypothetical protein